MLMNGLVKTWAALVTKVIDIHLDVSGVGNWLDKGTQGGMKNLNDLTAKLGSFEP
jgi:hypothetical protein